MKLTRRRLIRLIQESARSNSGHIDMIARMLTSTADVDTLRQYFELAIGLGHAAPDSFDVNDLLGPPIIGMTVSGALFHAINRLKTIHHFDRDRRTRMYRISYSV